VHPIVDFYFQNERKLTYERMSLQKFSRGLYPRTNGKGKGTGGKGWEERRGGRNCVERRQDRKGRGGNREGKRRGRGKGRGRGRKEAGEERDRGVTTIFQGKFTPLILIEDSCAWFCSLFDIQ
jgi:hypothetical protein